MDAHGHIKHKHVIESRKNMYKVFQATSQRGKNQPYFMDDGNYTVERIYIIFETKNLLSRPTFPTC